MRNHYKVVITDFLVDPTTEREILRDVAEVEALNVEFEEQLAGRVETADTIMMYHCMSLSRKTIERLEKCQLIVRCGVGFDNVDWQFAASLGIPVANVPDYGTEEVADSAIGLTLALTRGFHLLNSQLRHTPEPWSYKIAAPVRRLRGAVFGVVGLGRIGTACAQRAKAFGMDVVFYDPYKSDGYDKALQIRRVDTLEELLTQAYVVSLHCPLSPETWRLIGAPQIKIMQPGGYLVNTARGGVVHTDAIPDAIASRTVGRGRHRRARNGTAIGGRSLGCGLAQSSPSGPSPPHSEPTRSFLLRRRLTRNARQGSRRLSQGAAGSATPQRGKRSGTPGFDCRALNFGEPCSSQVDWRHTGSMTSRVSKTDNSARGAFAELEPALERVGHGTVGHRQLEPRRTRGTANPSGVYARHDVDTGQTWWPRGRWSGRRGRY